jgi:hypothetical protein
MVKMMGDIGRGGVRTMSAALVSVYVRLAAVEVA